MSGKLLRSLTLIITVVVPYWLQAQQATKYSLKEAVEYARKNNIVLQSARIDQNIAHEKVKETLADGLPQVSANLNYTNSPQIAVQRLPNFINEALPPGSPRGPEFIDAQFGIANTLGFVAQLNQLIFDGTYFLGIKAAREFVLMSELTTQRTEIETEATTIKAYYSVLAADKRITLIDENIRSLDSSFFNIKAMAEQGFAEQVDVSRIELSLSNLKIQKARLEDQRKIMANVLKLQMGLDPNQPIELTESLESLQQTFKVLEVSGNGNINARTEYQILEQQARLGQLDLKRYKMGYYPTLNGFVTHQENTFSNNGLSQLGNPWFPGTQWGLTLKIPIYTGGRRSAWIQQANMRLDKYNLQKKQFEMSYVNELVTARTTYLRALENYHLQERNIELSNEILRITRLKMEEGMGSSLDYTAAQTENNASKTNYIIAFYELIAADIDYRRATGAKLLD